VCDILPTIGCLWKRCQICPHRQLSPGADLTGNFQRNFEHLISGNNSQPKGCNAGFISDVNARSFHEERYKAGHLIENLSGNWVENPVVIGRLFDTIDMVVIPKVGGCEAAPSSAP
jgi:hypothetical protein